MKNEGKKLIALGALCVEARGLVQERKKGMFFTSLLKEIVVTHELDPEDLKDWTLEHLIVAMMGWEMDITENDVTLKALESIENMCIMRTLVQTISSPESMLKTLFEGIKDDDDPNLVKDAKERLHNIGDMLNIDIDLSGGENDKNDENRIKELAKKLLNDPIRIDGDNDEEKE